MWAYITRRVLYSVPILICVNLLTFFLFFYVNTPDDVAHTVLGNKYDNPATVYRWKREHRYHLPMFLNVQDSVLYLSNSGRVPTGVKGALSGYEIESFALGENYLNGDRRGNKEGEGKKQRYQRSLRLRIDEIVKKVDGNEIIIVDWPGMSDVQARILSSLLEKAVPFIVIRRQDKTVPRPLRVAPVSEYTIPAGSAGEKELATLRRYIDEQQAKGTGILTETIFFNKSVRLFWFDFGKSDRENVDISHQVLTRMGPSLMITVPAFVLGLGINIFISMIVAYCRGTYVDRMVAIVCIILMSILSLFYYFSAQLVFGVWLKIFPVSGYQPGFGAIRFVLLPIIVSVIVALGPGVRFYRTIFLEETNEEYVRTARAKGLNQAVVLFKHVLKNAMIPILTNVVMVIPMLFVGSLILESFFAIPGLGRFTLEGIQSQDFRIVGSMVYLGSFLYIVGLILTDISYTLVDPRVRLE